MTSVWTTLKFRKLMRVGMRVAAEMMILLKRISSMIILTRLTE